MPVVPSKIALVFRVKCRSAPRDEDPASDFTLRCSDEAFDHGDASMFSDRSVSRTDLLALAPSFEDSATENASLVADEMGRHRVRIGHHSFDEAKGGVRVWLLQEDRDVYRTSRVMINDHGQPPGEWPALRKSKRYPRGPEARTNADGGRIDMPSVIRRLRRNNATGRSTCSFWR